MFVYKNKLVTVKKITFSNMEKFLFFISILLPEIKDKTIVYKQKSKRAFKFVVKNLIDLICEPKIKPFFLVEYMYILQQITIFTKLYDILEKVENTKDTDKEKEIKTEKGEIIYKSQYTRLYLDNYYKFFLKYIPCFEDDFKKNIGFLEYEELINELEKNRLENNLQQIFNIGSGFGGAEETIKETQKRIKELDKFGFDEKRFREDLLFGIGGKKNG